MANTKSKELQIKWTGLENKNDKERPQIGIGIWSDCVYFLFRTPENKWGAAFACFGADDEAELIITGVSAHAATRAARVHCDQRQVERGY